MTYSLIFADTATGIVGGATQSHYPFVGATVLHARAGVGAAMSQASGDAAIAQRLVEALETGQPPAQALGQVLEEFGSRDLRQMAVVDAAGPGASHTGERCAQPAAEVTGHGYCAAGNMLGSDDVVNAMVAAFLETGGPHAHRLIAALQAADEQGGDMRGRQSAALIVAHPTERWRDVDVRVDDTPQPIAEVARLVKLRERYQVIEDPRLADDGRALDQTIATAEREGWPDEVRFWLGMTLAASGRGDDVSDAWRALAAQPPWNRVLASLQRSGWRTP